jgi:hypothetical protein
VHLDTTLNAVWLLLGLLALAMSIRTASRCRSSGRRWPKCLHAVIVAVIVSALFPYISATDDFVRVEHFTPRHHDQTSHHSKQGDNLLRLYEVMDAPLVCEVQRVLLTLLFIGLVVVPVAAGVDRIAPLIAGRSPPWFIYA